MPHSPAGDAVAHLALRRDEPVPLHARIREDLRERIARQTWAARERLPSEAELMRSYGVSRITVRQALHALEQQGVIVKVPGKGSFVAGPKPYQQLASLQGLGEAMSPQGHAISNRVLELSRAAADTTVAARLGLAPGTTVTHIRRLRLLNGQPISVDLTWLPLDLGDRIAGADLEHRDIFVMLERDFATPLGHADLALDAVLATPAIAQELGVPVGSPLLHVERLTHDRSGRPIDYEQLCCRSDNFQLRLRIDRQTGIPQ
jgi:GntR family transcriptional regulator